MTRLDTYLLAGIVAATILSATTMVTSSLHPEAATASTTEAKSKIGRYSVQVTDATGWNIFDNELGRFCFIPNNTSTLQPTCSQTPPSGT